MKRIVVLLFTTLLLMLLLSGCWDRTEVNDLAIITGAGLDLTDDNQLELSVKIYITSAASSQQQSGQQSQSSGSVGMSVVRSATGVTISDAVSNLQQTLTRKMFWGHNEVFLFGKALAENGIDKPMDFLTRHMQLYERANMFVSKTTAKEVLQLNPPIERSVSEALREMSINQTGLNITLKDLAQMMAGKSKAAILPMIEIKSKQKQQESFPYIHGAAVLKDGKMIGEVNERLTRGIMWLRNEVKEATITVTPANTDGIVSIKLLESHTNLQPLIEEDRWIINVVIHSSDDIVQNTTNLDLSVPFHIEKLQAELEDEINNRINQALDAVQKQMKADVFYFSDAFYRKYPKQWIQNRDKWEDIFPEVEVRLQTNVSIHKPGLTGKNIFKPNQE